MAIQLRGEILSTRPSSTARRHHKVIFVAFYNLYCMDLSLRPKFLNVPGPESTGWPKWKIWLEKKQDGVRISCLNKSLGVKAECNHVHWQSGVADNIHKIKSLKAWMKLSSSCLSLFFTVGMPCFIKKVPSAQLQSWGFHSSSSFPL